MLSSEENRRRLVKYSFNRAVDYHASNERIHTIAVNAEITRTTVFFLRTQQPIEHFDKTRYNTDVNRQHHVTVLSVIISNTSNWLLFSGRGAKHCNQRL